MTLIGSYAVWESLDKLVAIIDLSPRDRSDLPNKDISDSMRAGYLCHPRSFTGYNIISWDEFQRTYNITIKDVL